MILAVDGLAAFRGERLVLRDLSFSVPAGGALLLLGPNGAGKSTLLRLLAGLRRPDAGTIRWDGTDVADDPAAHAARVAYLGHQDAVKPALTVEENLRLPARIAGGGAEAVASALEAVGLVHLAALPARMLSAGQRRRLALARLALAGRVPGPAPDGAAGRPAPGDATLWLLDEPTLGLDAASVARLGGLLARHRAAGGVVVTATHLDLPLPGAAALRLGGPTAVADPAGAEG